MRAPEDRFVSVNGMRLHYLDWGNQGSPPLILLHGLCSNAHYWDFFADSVRDDFHVLALDQRGHGDSEWSRSYAPRDYVADLEAFVETLGLHDLMIIGHSMGGVNAILFSARRPDRMYRLVVVDIGPELSNEGAERLKQEMATFPTEFDSMDSIYDYLRLVHPRYGEGFLCHQIRHATRSDQNGRFSFKFDLALNETRMGSPEWLWEYLEGITCPTLIIRGTESDVLDDHVACRMIDILPDGVSVDIRGACHSVPGDNPGEFEKVVLRFLRTR